MASIIPTPQSDMLEQSLSTQAEVPEPALRALWRVRELERELMALRGALAHLPDRAQLETAWHDQVANLLSRVVVFRVALAKTPALNDTVSGSGRDELSAIAYRALRE